MVLNHPLWNLYQHEASRFRNLLDDLLGQYSAFIHAFEVNGLRTWKENQSVAELAYRWNQLVVSGGDRHGCEPNANVNITNAQSFSEFAHEVRVRRVSHVLFMPQYADPLGSRWLRLFLDATRYYPDMPRGAQSWDDRTFHPDANGACLPALFPLEPSPQLPSADLCDDRNVRVKPSPSLATNNEPKRACPATRPGRWRRISMTSSALRVAFFPDSYNEVNGVAHTARQFEQYARRHGVPMLLVTGANESRVTVEDSITRMELKRGCISFALDRDLRFDLAFLRHYRRIAAALREFKPDLLHVTGPNDVGISGVIAAHKLGIPLAASWHTNVHEYAARRAKRIVPTGIAKREGLTQYVQDTSFKITARYFQIARWLYAPNQELIDQLGAATGKPCFLMARGVDATAFNPSHRDRKDGKIVVGYVGRSDCRKERSRVRRAGTRIKSRRTDQL